MHIVFDCPGIWGFNLKQKVQEGRDSTQNVVKVDSFLVCSPSCNRFFSDSFEEVFFFIPHVLLVKISTNHYYFVI